MTLRAQGIDVSYGSFNALRHASFTVGAGEIVALLGANGAGKSTALRSVSGMLDFYAGHVTQGRIILDHCDITGVTTDEVVRLGVAIVPEGRRLFGSLSVYENLELGAHTRTDRKRVCETLDEILDLLPHLRPRLRQRADTLSGGEQQMLSIGRALMLRPKLLLADEPSIGLSPDYAEIVFDRLVEVSRGAVGVLLAEQNVQAALRVCDRAYLFEQGEILVEGPREQVRRHPLVSRLLA